MSIVQAKQKYMEIYVYCPDQLTTLRGLEATFFFIFFMYLLYMFPIQANWVSSEVQEPPCLSPPLPHTFHYSLHAPQPT